VTWRVNQVQVVNLPIASAILQRSGLRFDGDAAFFFDIHRVQNLSFHLPLLQSSTALDQSVSQGRFAMINVGDDGKISDVLHQ
jgi:hypothetical protein